MYLQAGNYYAWVNRPPSKRAWEEAKLEVENIIPMSSHRRTRETCGAERLQCDLAEHGVEVVGVCRIKRIRKKLGLKCKQQQKKKKFKATTDSNHMLPAAENLLEQEFEASAPNEVWVTDITYISTEEGW